MKFEIKVYNLIFFKKFFLRSINGEDAKYKCIRNQDCVIVRSTRTQCQYCRFQKCKEVGMTINGEKWKANRSVFHVDFLLIF